MYNLRSILKVLVPTGASCSLKIGLYFKIIHNDFNNAPINVRPAGGEGKGAGFD